MLCNWLVFLFLLCARCAHAQTTETVRLYGTYNVNRNINGYDERGRYASAYASSTTNTTQNKDVIYWERTKDQMRDQYRTQTGVDRYSPNWGANDRVLAPDPIYSRNDPPFSRYSNSGVQDFRNPPGNPYSRPADYDLRNQNYDSKALYDSKRPTFESASSSQSGGGGGGGVVASAASPSGSSSSVLISTSSAGGGGAFGGASVGGAGRDRASQIAWERELERERERERERQRELERDRTYFLNSRTRYNTNPLNSNNYASNIPRVKLPGCGVFDEWRTDLMGQCRPDYAANVQERDISVTTPYGRIRGFYTHLFDGPGVVLGDRPGVYHSGKLWRTVSTFLGIPYAQPPVNEGRFKPPRPKRAWSLWDAIDFGPACPQPIQYVGASKGVRYMNEDCLYLNIYTPTTGAIPEKYPVIFYIHGGEFERGASSTFPGHMLAAVGDVVVVTVNYRLGALGFLSTGNEYSPGNYGMLDLTMALQWVSDNIYAFNGNKDMITVYGPGSGAAAASLLAMAPKSRHLVRQVFAQSGSPLAEWAAIPDLFRMQNTSRLYADRLGCVVEQSYKLIECLRSRSFEELGNIRLIPDIGMWPWAPVVDGEIRKPGNNWYEGWQEKDWQFLDDVPEELVRLRKFNPAIRYMTGVTADEAAYVVYNNKSLLPNFEITEQFFDNKVREYVHHYNYTLNPDGIFRAIEYMYTYWPDPKNQTHIREQFINFLSDALYKSPVDKMVKMMVDNDVPTYMYVLNTTINALNYPYWSRVPHNIEYYFLTGAPFLDPEFLPEDLRVERKQWNEDDRRMSEFMMKTLTNFARYGRPTPVAIYNINWPEMRRGWLQYLNLNRTDNSTLILNYRQKECSFWSEYMPSVVGFLLPTFRPFTEYWWEPSTPISIAFWSVSGVCLMFIMLCTLCCCLWLGAKRANKKLLADNYLNHELIITENLHTASKELFTNGKMKSSESIPSTLV